MISHPRVSSEHAVVVWDEGWFVRDLGSRNGTFLDGTVLTSGRAFRLALRAQVAFGQRDERWVLVDDEPPGGGPEVDLPPDDPTDDETELRVARWGLRLEVGAAGAVMARLRTSQGEIDLGARAHHRLLLALAQARLRDHHRGIEPVARGWVARDDLERHLGVDDGGLQALLRTARAQLSKVDADSVVEERAGDGALRTVVDHPDVILN